jgi:hypothetical protein
LLTLPLQEVSSHPDCCPITARIGEVTSADWGWHQTVSQNLERFSTSGDAAGGRASELLELMNSWPKTRRWNMRARVGTRKKWYRLPEEIAHGSSAGGG